MANDFAAAAARADPDLDRAFAFPISRHSGGVTAADTDCHRQLRQLRKRVIVLATSRSGSEYLSGLLQGLGIDAHEYLNRESSVSRGHNIGEGQDPAVFLAALCRRLPNGILCTKAHMQALMMLFEIGEFPAHIHEWHFIHLSRRNVIRQAISLMLAEMTGAYRADLQPTRSLECSDLTFAAVSTRIDRVLVAREWLDRFVALFGITPLRITFEDLRAAPEEELGRIAGFLGLPDTRRASIDQDRLPREQGTDLNRRLEAAFRAEIQFRMREGRASRELLLAAPAPAGTSPPPRSAASAGQSEVALRVPIDSFEYEQGFCWLYRLRHTAQGELFVRLADDDQAKERSTLLLYENGRPLGPAHAGHAIIRSRGTGAYSHWKDDLYFSTSDNSDPNRNGRRYDIVLLQPKDPPTGRPR